MTPWQSIGDMESGSGWKALGSPGGSGWKSLFSSLDITIPSDISDLELWLTHSGISGAEGASLADWGDASPFDRHAIETDVLHRPIVNLNALGERSAVRFHGTDGNNYSRLLLPNFLTSFSEVEVFIVFKSDSDVLLQSTHGGLWSFGPDPDGWFPYYDGFIYETFGTTVRKTTGNPIIDLSSGFHLYNITSKAGEFTTRFDGVQHFTTSFNTVGFSTIPAIGSAYPLSKWFEGQILELFLFSRDLEIDERDKMVVYWENLAVLPPV